MQAKQPTGHECYWCFAVRRKWEKALGEQYAQPILLKKCKEGGLGEGYTMETFELDRAAYGNGTLKGRAIDHAETSQQASAKEGHFAREFSTGHFYPLDGFVQLLLPDQDLSKWTEADLRKYLGRHHPETKVVRDRAGLIGVKEESLPAGATYKYEEGRFAENAFTEVAKLDDDEDMADLQAGEHRADHSLACEELEPLEGDSDDMDETRPGRSATSHGAAAGSASSSGGVAPAPDATRGEGRKWKKLPLLMDLHPAQKCLPTLRDRQPGQPPTLVQSVWDTHRARLEPGGSRSDVLSEPSVRSSGSFRESQEPGAGGPCAAADGNEATVKHIIGKIKSNKAPVVLLNSEKLFEVTSKTFSLEVLWREPKRKREIETRCNALQTAANRVAKVVGAAADADVETAHTRVAEKLLDLRKVIIACGMWFERVRNHAVEALQDFDAQKDFVELLSPGVSRHVMLELLCNSIRATWRSPYSDPFEVSKILRGVVLYMDLKPWVEDNDILSMSHLSKHAAAKVQTSVVVEFVEKLLQLPASKTWQLLDVWHWVAIDNFDSGVPPSRIPTLETCFFSPTPDQTETWCPQAFRDVSFLVVAVAVLSLGKKLPSKELTRAAISVVGNKTQVSVRLRTSSRAATASSSKPLIALSWEIMEGFAKASKGAGETLVASAATWREYERIDLVAMEDDAFFQLVDDWVAADMAQIVRLAECVTNAIESTEEWLPRAKAWMMQLRKRLASMIEHLIDDGCSQEALAKVLNVSYVPSEPHDPAGEQEAAWETDAAEHDDDVDDVKFMVSLVQFFDTVDVTLHGATNRKDKGFLDELRKRMDFLGDTLLLREKVGSTGAERIGEWSDLYVRGRGLPVAEVAATAELKNMSAAVQRLRSVDVSSLAAAIVSESCGVNRDREDPAVLAVAKQYKGALPPSCSVVIDLACAHSEAKALTSRIDSKASITLTEVICVHVNNMVTRQEHAPEKVKLASDQVEAKFQQMWDMWVKDMEPTKRFDELMEFLGVVVPAAEDGDFKKCLWVKEKENEEVQEKVKDFEKIWVQAKSNARIANGVVSALTSLPSGDRFRSVAQAVASRTFRISKLGDRCRDVLATVAFSNALMVEPRPATLKKTIEKQEAHFKKMGFDPSKMLPKYIRSLFLECVGSEETKATDKVQNPSAASAAARGPIESGGVKSDKASELQPARAEKRKGPSLADRVAKKKRESV